ncbi:MAG: FtsX-like permease family protein, partial [Bacteroidales bacterium]|nr:FtsX-like permease family protein [Bacteroidales bacterium]
IAFNIFGSLSMLIIEKEEDIKTLSAIGASKKFIKRIFVLEGWMVSLLGLAAGLVLGVGLSLLQQHFGLVKMPQGFFLQAYPAQLQCSDVLITAISVAVIGFLIALLSISKKEFKIL